MEDKPKFNPNASFEVVDTEGEKPKFDPNKSFKEVPTTDEVAKKKYTHPIWKHFYIEIGFCFIHIGFR